MFKSFCPAHCNISENEIPSPQFMQLIALSATIGNIELLSQWFHASLYRTSFRPVPLVEYIQAGNSIYDKMGRKIRDQVNNYSKTDPDNILALSFDAIRKNQQVLIFCPSRLSCQLTCQMLSETICKDISMTTQGDSLTARKVFIEKLLSTNPEIDPILQGSLLQGVAYHHAGE